MNKHRYILKPYKGKNTRHHCPACNDKDKTFSLYIDADTNMPIDPSVGRCNRESNCGYHYTPRQYFQENHILFEIQTTKPVKLQTRLKQKPVSYIPAEVLEASLKNYESNQFVNFLIDLFGTEVTSQLISKYFIGTSNHWDGATVFWQIDNNGKIRTGKIMLYNPDSGKRVKDPFNHITWVHTVLKQPDYELKQCMFGEHLLTDLSKPVAIVESEKTSIIASVYLPQFIWLAVGSLTNLNEEKCQVLKGRTVVLFPDLSGFNKWSSKAKELSTLAHFAISDLLERKATEQERQQGLDIADYLIRFDYRQFIIPASKPEPIPKNIVETEISNSEENLLLPPLSGLSKQNEPAKTISQNIESKLELRHQTYGEVFDLLKARGYKNLPKNIQINVPGWN